MKIVRHRLHTDDGEPVPFVRTPNASGELEAKYLVIHFTAGRSADESVRWLTNPAARASAHLVIGRDGSITQLVPFNRVAWHAGASRWEGISGLNRHSIGIELDNAGRLRRQGEQWCAWFGRGYPEDEVMEAVHKHESTSCGWHAYTPEQLDAVLEAALCIDQKYGLRDVVGHDDIAPGRKCDPGPPSPCPTSAPVCAAGQKTGRSSSRRSRRSISGPDPGPSTRRSRSAPCLPIRRWTCSGRRDHGAS